jgi:S1-C subfamily serine protease
VSRTIDNSVIIAKVQQVMPPLPDELATVERYLSTSGFPQVLANVVPQSVAPVTVAGSAELRAAVSSAGPSTVRVLGEGCGDIQEGTGFVVANGLVVTNAHVVAGTETLSVTAPDASPIPAAIISFDPDLDLALLRPANALGLPSLTVDPVFESRGVMATVLGYPEDGPFDAQPAGIIARFDAQGRNIYDTGLTNRTVYELQAKIRPGNSGGPLVAANGEVIGVVFSRSTTQATVGYALASPAVLAEIQRASPDQAPVGSGACVS